MEIRYRNGVPTRKDMRSITKAFFGEEWYKVRLGAFYGTRSGPHKIVWQCYHVQEKIYDFAKRLDDLIINCKIYRAYEPPISGSLEILKNSITKN